MNLPSSYFHPGPYNLLDVLKSFPKLEHFYILDASRGFSGATAWAEFIRQFLLRCAGNEKETDFHIPFGLLEGLGIDNVRRLGIKKELEGMQDLQQIEHNPYDIQTVSRDVGSNGIKFKFRLGRAWVDVDYRLPDDKGELKRLIREVEREGENPELLPVMYSFMF